MLDPDREARRAYERAWYAKNKERVGANKTAARLRRITKDPSILVKERLYTIKWEQEHPGYGARKAKQYRDADPEKHKTRSKRYRANHPHYNRDYHRRQPKPAMLCTARVRAKKRGVPCTITTKDIIIPEFCPLLGIALKVGVKNNARNSPSLDCINPALGYVPGNVWVISLQANRIKSDATSDEIMKVALGLKARKL